MSPTHYAIVSCIAKFKTMIYDYIIIGAGIMGLTIAYELRKRYPVARIALIEKEAEVAQHASGRNSGVLHAGFYYTSDSLKAKFAVAGNRAMKQFCQLHDLPINPCQKLVVARNADELLVLEQLYQRGIANGVEVELFTEQQAKNFEKNVKTYQKALFSPSTASVNPMLICLKIKQLLLESKVDIFLGQRVISIKENSIKTDQEIFNYAHLINAAGLYADKIAHQVGCGKQYTLLPFKGRYIKSAADAQNLSTNIYPVPNLANPFLGVHFTKSVDNSVKIGPTAIPSLWRENYGGLKNFKLAEALEILYYQAKLFAKNSFNFRALAFSEIKKYRKSVLIKEAATLVNSVGTNYKKLPSGIRAQLLDINKNQLVMDFVIEHDKNTTHILNAISPAFTCSFAFAEHTVNEIEKHQQKEKTNRENTRY